MGKQRPDGGHAGGDHGTELDRREMMKLLGAGLSLAGLGGCMETPAEGILPRAALSPESRPGMPIEYATSLVLDGFATGVLCKALDGRPIKIEGNPDHPASLGATSAWQQAAILGLYEPARARSARARGQVQSAATLTHLLSSRRAMPGLWFLSHPESSPLVASLMDRIRERHPSARFVFDSPVGRRSVYQGARLAFGRAVEAQYRFDRADVWVALDDDFAGAGPNSVRWARDFARRRRLASPGGDPGRLHVAEPRPTATGTLADERAAMRAVDIGPAAVALLGAVIRAGRRPPGLDDSLAGQVARVAPSPAHARWVEAAARDLVARPGRGLVVAGQRQPAWVHAIVHLIGAALGNHGETVAFAEPALIDPLGLTLDDLVAAARAGEVKTLAIIDANPVYTAPADLELARLVAGVPETIHLAEIEDETTAACAWFLPRAHALESWGDARAYDGTVSLIQPLIRPLHGGLAMCELLAIFAGIAAPRGRDLLRARGGRAPAQPRTEQVWREDLIRGFEADTASPIVPAAITSSPALERAVSAALAAVRAVGSGTASREMELALAPSEAVHDGRLAHIGWLQEMPQPVTKLTWGNAALVSPATAARLGVASGDVVRLRLHGRELDAPALIQAGTADDSISIALGYGHSAGAGVGRAVGVNAFRLRTSRTGAFSLGLEVEPTGERRPLARTQEVFDEGDREIALAATLGRYRAHPDFTARHRGPLPSLLPDLTSGQPQWGMTIDTMICSGCSACVVACQAENNVPIVGPQGVLDHREMHWLRIDTYQGGSAAAPGFVHQPMLCQHCEKAPCEYVCPTYATSHSPDGLNEMTYNRCIGTRFCSNNCPYKVRRFNWFDYTEDAPALVQLGRNPNVTVRARGVMEKCTFCVQRIRSAEIQSRMERRAIRPGEVVTACQQACPTGAIQFGALHHGDTEVVVRRREDRAYEVLHELGTRPRTIYLARITNPAGEGGE